VQPFLDRADKGVVILCHTSNPGAADLQDLVVEAADGPRRPLYQHLARTIARDWNANGNCVLVTGATWPEQLAQVRALVGDMPLLVPGIGAQGGDVEAVVRNGRTAAGSGLLISSSRAILYAGHDADFAAAARKATLDLRALVNRFRA
jgi:orotidine-5'-phosphate decarboxylase